MSLSLLVRAAGLGSRGRRIEQGDDVVHRPQRLGDAGRHRGRHLHGAVDPHEVVPDGVERNHMAVVLKLLGVRVREPSVAALSNDPKFAAKVRDIVGLYVDPPAHSVVLSVDEKSQIQDLDRTQPGLPLKKGRAGTMTHDYKRHGTTTLFAALNVLDGEVIGECMPRHRAGEFIRFLNAVEREVPAGKTVHAILDNYATHKHPAVKRWLKAHPRFHLHFTPTSASWLNMVERFFAEITRKRIRRGAFKSVAELKSAIMEYLENHNADPKPFIWTKSAGQILEKVARAKQALESQH